MRHVLRRARTSWLVASFLAATCVSCAGVSAPHAQRGPHGETACEREALVPGDYRRSVDVGTATRTYRLHVPAGYQQRRATPLVVAFHGHDSSAQTFDEMARLGAASEREGFILALPDGLSQMNDRGTWNAGACCGHARKNGADDVAFARALVDAVDLDVCVDRRRVYALGFSSGAMLVERLACQAADRFVAVASVGGALTNVDRSVDPPAALFPCEPAAPVSVLLVHGTSDGCVPFNKGSCWPSRRRCDDVYGSVPDDIAGWLRRKHCDVAVTPGYANGAARCEIHTCEAGTAVEVCLVTSGGHSWPGGARAMGGAAGCARAKPTRDMDATSAAWAFFAAHPRGARP